MALVRPVAKYGILCLAALVCLVPMCQASLIGTTVTGVITGVPDLFAENFYDPANGNVPATGFQNSPDSQDSATVTIVGGNEFGFDTQGPDTSFSATGFAVNVPASPRFVAFGGYRLTFTDAAFQSVSLISNTFPDLTYSILGNVITINIPFTTENPPDSFSASFAVNGVPEPSSLAFLAIGGAGLALCKSFGRA